MIKQGLRNYFKSLRHFFTPLGTMFLAIMLGLSVVIPNVIGAASSLIDGLKGLITNVNLDLKGLLDNLWTAVISLDWENAPEQALQTMFSAEWLNGMLTEILQYMLGTDFETFKQQIVTLVSEFTAQVIANAVVFVIFWILGFLAGFALIRFFIRRDIAKRSLWKFILAYFINGFLSATLVVLCIFVFSVWKASIYISVIVLLLLAGAFSLIEAYLLYGCKKIKFGKILNAKNIGLYTLTNLIIFAISVAFTLVAVSINSLTGLFVGLSLVVIALIVISLNAESYVQSAVKAELTQAEYLSACSNADGSTSNNCDIAQDGAQPLPQTVDGATQTDEDGNILPY